MNGMGEVVDRLCGRVDIVNVEWEVLCGGCAARLVEVSEANEWVVRWRLEAMERMTVA